MPRRFELNPPGAEAAYLRGLQASFPGWGDRTDFAWWFRRAIGARPADLLTLAERDVLIAGMALSYRRFHPGGGAAESLVAILSAAWTRPEHRRGGCFAELVEHADTVAASRGAVALLAFVSGGRASRRVLEAAASERIASWQLRSGPRLAGEPPAPAARRPAPDAAALRRWFHEHRAGGGFVYPSPGVFAEQARLSRGGVAVADAADGHWAIVDDERVRAVLHESAPLEADATAAALAQVARGRRPGLRAYTTQRRVAEAAQRAGFEADEAQLVVLPVGGRPTAPLRVAEAWLHELDRA